MIRYAFFSLAAVLLVFELAGAQTSHSWQTNTDGLETLESRHPVRANYERVPVDSGSFAAFLRSLPLMPEGTPLRRFDGSRVLLSAYAGAIIDLDVGERDLQQCADTLIRLFAEYQLSSGAAETLSFNFTSGDTFAYRTFLAGRRPVVDGSRVSWQSVQPRTHSRETFMGWLDILFTYAGTASLARDLPKVAIGEAQIGDLFISPGFPGHAAMIADMAVNPETGETDILLLQGFTPAQNAHVVRNVWRPWKGEWFPLSAEKPLVTPVWDFQTDELHRFTD